MKRATANVVTVEVDIRGDTNDAPPAVKVAGDLGEFFDAGQLARHGTGSSPVLAHSALPACVAGP